MQDSLQDQLRLVKENSLSVFCQGPTEIEEFLRSWSALSVTISGTKNDLDEGTLSLAHEVATSIEIISSRFLELYEETDAITSSFQKDLDVIFADLQIEEPSATLVNLALLPYLESAHTWLLNNLHNPYPSREMKSYLAKETGSSRKDIGNWFINVRKRIGWNKLRLKHYSNKRSKIVDAATLFFKGIPHTSHYGPYTTHTSRIDPTPSHDSEFKSVEKRAKELYSDGLFETSLATKFDGIGPKAKIRTQAEVHRRQVAKSRRSKHLQHLSTYPSPERSPERSPEPLPESSPEHSSDSSLPMPDTIPVTNLKRRNSDRDSPELEAEDRRDEPRKRSRLDSYQISRDLAIASLPSPAASLSDITRESSVTPSDLAPSGNDCIILPTPPIPTTTFGKRKRRLSDAGHDGPSKRPHNTLAVPRLQTVSDPLPVANPIISDFYKTMFSQTIGDSIPGPVGVESLDDSQVEVDFYNYDTSRDVIQSFLLTDSSSAPYPAAPSLLSTTNSESPSLDKSQVPDPTLDFLFKNYLNTPQVTDISFFTDIPSRDHSTFENIFPTQPPQEDILFDPYIQIPGLWDFQGNDDTFSNLVPSIGSLFSSNPVLSPQIDSNLNEKEAKRKQIEALRAQLQSLEAEP